MKKIITFTIVFILSFSFLNRLKAQQLDTLNYVKQFEVNKANFINKPFSYLLNQMVQLKPKTVNSLPKVWGKDMTPESIFNFTEKDYQYNRKTVTIIIIWQNPLVHSQALELSKQNHFNFTQAEEAFYGDKIIEDIKVYKR